MKTIYRLILLLLVSGYLIWSVIYFLGTESQSVCQGIDIEIVDSARGTLIRSANVAQMLQQHNLMPTGRNLHQARLTEMEQMLRRDPFILSTLCVCTPYDRVRIRIWQRLPLLRVIADNGDDYYIDHEGRLMPARGYEADLPVVTGNVSPRFAKRHLTALGRYLNQNDFWRDQVVQINVLPDEQLDLAMRVGCEVVHFGPATNFNTKFRNLYAFYTKVLPKVGWHKYEALTVAFENQVIGHKAAPPSRSRSAQ